MFKKLIFSFAIAVWAAAWMPLLVIALPSKWLSRKFMVADAWGWLAIARIFAGIKYKIHPHAICRGMTNGQQTPRPIIASKHMSTLEVAILITHIPNSFFIIKRELMWIPIYGWSFWRMGLQPVNRAAGATNMAKLTTAVKKKIDSGMTLIIFPEGTRAKPNVGTGPRAPLKLKRGLLFIAESLKLPIQPVGADTGLYWPKKGPMHGGTANLWFEPLLPYNASLEEIAESISRHSA